MMKTNTSTQSRLAIIFFMIIFLSVSCGGGGGGDDDDDANNDTIQNEAYLTGNDMLIVLDTYGNPISNALVEENAITDANGVTIDDFETSAAGWIRVAAQGFASGYSEAINGDDVRVFELRLTPVQVAIKMDSDDITSIYTGDSENPVYRSELNATNFESHPVTVSFTSINPIYVLPLFEPLSSGEDLTLQKAFAIEAVDSDLKSIALKSGSTIVIRVRDDGVLSDDTVLAYFDPEIGRWEVVPGGCARDGSNHFNCTLAKLSPLYGLFAAQDATYLARRFQTAESSTDELGDAWSLAKQKVSDRLKDLKSCMAEGTCDPTEDSEMTGAVNSMVDTARSYADENQNEKGKMALLAAQLGAKQLGFDQLASELNPEVESITNKLGQDYVNNGNCGRIKEMLHIQRQFMILGGDQQILSQLEQKLEEYFQVCDLWVGKISYYYWNGPGDPCSGDLTGGGGVWIENHSVRIPTHVNTHAVSGEDKVSLNFQDVTFSSGGECPSTTKIYYGNPDVSDLFLSFDGTYDGIEFNVNTPGPSTNPIEIVQDYVMKTMENDECTVVNDPNPIVFPGFSSALVHGFNGSPPVTLQEMLDNGDRGSYGEYETIRGREEFTNACFESNLGRYPFDKGNVNWFFWHERKVLPLSE